MYSQFTDEENRNRKLSNLLKVSPQVSFESRFSPMKFDNRAYGLYVG